MVDKLTFIGGGDGLNAPIRLRVPRDKAAPSEHLPEAPPPPHRRIAGPALLALWLLVGTVAALLRAAFPAWDYKITSPHDMFFAADSAREGSAGWEMVTARRATDEGSSARYEIIWKRRRLW